MKTPRNINGLELSKLLRLYGYIVIRQTGSHIRLSTNENGEHNITIPSHNPLKIGTLNSIIKDISEHFNKTKQEVLQDLFK
ncbi:MAG TPA: type II toxin-antitoxin system HicA family toxin [Candidatus Kapabacteria bacterium]|nr:type II toxin-antitoxin system HicA family toxin [Candidatus Kapabacteria bacterium]